MVTTDEKSGYDHVRLSVESQKYFGIQFGYWVLVYTVNLHIPNKRHDRNVLPKDLPVVTVQHIDDRLGV